MSFEAVTIVEGAGTVLSLIGVGYGAASWRQRRENERFTLERSLEVVRLALHSIEFTEFEVVNSTATRGTDLQLRYSVESRTYLINS